MSEQNQETNAGKTIERNDNHRPVLPKVSGPTGGRAKASAPPRELNRPENPRMQRPRSALDRKLSKQPVSSQSRVKESEEMLVRREFQTALNKLSSSDTRELGMKEARTLIEKHCTGHDLRIYISTLCDQKRNLDSSTKEMEVLLLGCLATTYKDQLLDPLDRPPSLIKSTVRLCESVHSYLKDTTSGVQSACARSLIEIYASCLSGESMEIVTQTMTEPLLSILNGGADKATQYSASVCLCDFLYYMRQQGRLEIIDAVCDKLYNLLLKTHHDFIEFLRAIGICIAANKMRGLSERLTPMLSKLTGIVTSNKQQSHYYLNKVEACTTLTVIAKVLANQNVPLSGELRDYYDKLIAILKDAAKNKLARVQKAGSEALRAWQMLGQRDDPNVGDDMGDQVLLPEEEEKLQALNNQQPSSAIESGEKSKRDTFKVIRDKFKKNKQDDPDSAVSISKAERNMAQFVQDAWGAHKNAQNFTRARSGTGGGHVNWSPPTRNGKALKKKVLPGDKKNIKDLILQYQAKRQKNETNEKFGFLPENYLRSKPTEESKTVDKTGSDGTNEPGELLSHREKTETKAVELSLTKEEGEASQQKTDKDVSRSTTQKKHKMPASIDTGNLTGEEEQEPGSGFGTPTSTKKKTRKSKGSRGTSPLSNGSLSPLSNISNKRSARRKEGRKSSQKQNKENINRSATSLTSNNSQRNVDPDSAPEDQLVDDSPEAEKVSIKPHANQQKSEAVRQMKPLESIHQQLESSQKDSKSAVSEMNEKEVEALSDKSQPFDQNHRYTLFGSDKPIEQATNYLNNSELKSENNMINEALDQDYAKRLKEQYATSAADPEELEADNDKKSAGGRSDEQNDAEGIDVDLPADKELSNSQKRTTNRKRTAKIAARTVSSSGALQLSPDKALVLEEEEAESGEKATRLRAVAAESHSPQKDVADGNGFFFEQEDVAAGDQQINRASASHTSSTLKPFHGEGSKLNPLGSHLLENTSDVKSGRALTFDDSLKERTKLSETDKKSMGKFPLSNQDSLELQSSTVNDAKERPLPPAKYDLNTKGADYGDADEVDSLEGGRAVSGEEKELILSEAGEQLGVPGEEEVQEDVPDRLETIRESPEGEFEPLHLGKRSEKLKKSLVREIQAENLRDMHEGGHFFSPRTLERHVTDVIVRSGIRVPQEVSPAISTGGHVDYLKEMIELEDLLKTQVRTQLKEAASLQPQAKSDIEVTCEQGKQLNDVKPSESHEHVPPKKSQADDHQLQTYTDATIQHQPAKQQDTFRPSKNDTNAAPQREQAQELHEQASHPLDSVHAPSHLREEQRTADQHGSLPRSPAEQHKFNSNHTTEKVADTLGSVLTTQRTEGTQENNQPIQADNHYPETEQQLLQQKQTQQDTNYIGAYEILQSMDRSKALYSEGRSNAQQGSASKHAGAKTATFGSFQDSWVGSTHSPKQSNEDLFAAFEQAQANSYAKNTLHLPAFGGHPTGIETNSIDDSAFPDNSSKGEGPAGVTFKNPSIGLSGGFDSTPYTLSAAQTLADTLTARSNDSQEPEDMLVPKDQIYHHQLQHPHDKESSQLQERTQALEFGRSEQARRDHTASKNIERAMQRARASEEMASEMKSGGILLQQKKAQEQEEGVPALQTWQNALSAMENGDYELAYSKLLASGDDIYLLRMMKLTGPCLKHLQRPTALRLIKRISLLMRSGFTEKTSLGFLEGAHHHDIVKDLKIGRQNTLVQTLKSMAAKQTSLGPSSAALVSKIQKSFHYH